MSVHCAVASGHIRSLIRTAFRKTGVYPLDPSQISPAMMAPSKETSYVNSLPLPAPSTPVHVLSNALTQCHKRPHADSDTSSASSPVRGHIIDNDDIFAVAQTARKDLANSSGSFLVSSSPIQSSSNVPTYSHPSLSPLRRLASSKLKPRTQNEKILAGKLKEVTTVVNYQRATIVAQGEYVGAVRAQLATSEKKKQPRGRLPIDSNARLVSDDDFTARVEAWEKEQERQKEQAAKRQADREEMSEAVKDWKDRETARKKANADMRAQWQADVAEWEVERDLAKKEKRRTHWVKPQLRGRLLKPIPKPKVAVAGGGDEDDDEELDEDEASDDMDDER